jgi:P pilus assembly chaperone PapD
MHASKTYLLLLAFLVSSAARANLQVFPTRLLLNDKKRVANVALRHLGDKQATYQVTAVFYRMNQKGSFEEVKDPTAAERPLGKYLRFSPREVTLAPQKEQVVRVMYAGPGNLPEGEYRAHLHIAPIGDIEKKADAADSNDKIQLQIEARLAFAIPVLFRRGNPKYQASLSNVRVLKAEDSVPSVSIDVNWTGNAYPYGDYVALFTPKDGEASEIGQVRGAAAYVSPRTVTFPVTLAPDKLKNGKLKVEFRDTLDNGAKVLGTTEATLP